MPPCVVSLRTMSRSATSCRFSRFAAAPLSRIASGKPRSLARVWRKPLATRRSPASRCSDVG